MFCKWCGKKMASNVSECPVCGKKQGALEQGTHFGDLCENYNPSKPSAPAGGTNNGQSAPHPGGGAPIAPSVQDQVKSLPFILAAASAVLSLICLIFMISFGAKINRVSKDFAEAQTAIENLRAEIDELTGNGDKQEGNDPAGETPDSEPPVTEDPAVTEPADDTTVSDEAPAEAGVPVGDAEALRSVYMHKSAPELSLAESNIKETDGANLTCAAVKNDGKTEYIVSGNWVDKELLDRWEHTLYWQQSNDSGETWTAVNGKKDNLSVETSDSDIRYRAICVVREATIIDLSTLEGNNNPDLYKVECDGATATLTITDDTAESAYQIGWIRSENGGDWDGTDERTNRLWEYVPEANDSYSYPIDDQYKYHALVIIRNTYYFAEAEIIALEPIDSDAETESTDTTADNPDVGGVLGGTGEA